MFPYGTGTYGDIVEAYVLFIRLTGWQGSRPKVVLNGSCVCCHIIPYRTKAEYRLTCEVHLTFFEQHQQIRILCLHWNHRQQDQALSASSEHIHRQSHKSSNHGVLVRRQYKE
jgi:hypothetical protein